MTKTSSRRYNLYLKIIVALSETDRLMKEVDKIEIMQQLTKRTLNPPNVQTFHFENLERLEPILLVYS